MNRQDAEEFTETLGQIAGGAWRQIALAKRLGVPEALGLSVDEWVNRRLGGYIRMSAEDRRPVVRELHDEGMSTRAIAEVVGVDQATVVRDMRSDANASRAPVLAADSDANASPLGTAAAVPPDDEETFEPITKPLAPPSNGMQFAKLAVMDLEKIRVDDTERKAAFAYVKRWLRLND